MLKESLFNFGLSIFEVQSTMCQISPSNGSACDAENGITGASRHTHFHRGVLPVSKQALSSQARFATIVETETSESMRISRLKFEAVWVSFPVLSDFIYFLKHSICTASSNCLQLPSETPYT